MQHHLQVGISNSLSSSVGYCSEVESRKYGSGQAHGSMHCICMASTVVTEWGSVSSLGTNDGVVYAGTQNGTILVYNEKGGPNCLVPVAQLTCRGPVKALLVVQENRAYTAHHDNKVRVWRKQPRFKFLKALPTAKDHIRKWMNSFHESFLQTNTKRLHSRIRPWMEHFDAVTSLALMCAEEGEEGMLYSGSWDKTVKVWRLSDLRCLESINAHDDAVNTLTTARNGILFTGSADGTIKVWKRTPTTSLTASRRSHHQHITTLSCHSQEGHVDNDNSAVNCVVLSPDESILYCGTSKGEINYWRMDKGSLNMCNEDALCGHERSVLCLTTLKKFVCSGSADTTIRVWVREATSAAGSGSFRHSCLQVLEGHRGPVKCITAVSSVPESLSSISTSLSSSSSSPSNNSSSSSSQYHNSSSSSQYRNLTRNGFVVYSGSLDATVKLWWVFYDGKHYERSWMT